MTQDSLAVDPRLTALLAELGDFEPQLTESGSGVRCRVVDADVTVRFRPSGPATAAYVPPVPYVDLLRVREHLPEGLGARIERQPDGRYAVVVEAKGTVDDPASLARWARTNVETFVQARLGDVVVSCSCGKEMNLDGAFRAAALRPITPCTGRSPWLRSPAVTCSEVPRTLQRGASNVWYPVLRSALSIPPWSEGAFRSINKYWSILRAVPEGALQETIRGLNAPEKSGYSVDDLVAAVVRRKRDLDGSVGEAGESGIRSQEYEALYRGRPETASNQDFVAEAVVIEGTPLAKWLTRVMAVTRLREVRALQSFTRVEPPGPADGPERRAALFESDPGWLPAIEVSGEGVFVVLDGARLARWEADPGVVARLKPINDRYRARFAAIKKDPDREITPRMILLHTIAHLLISQWALECGYPAAALRERIYAGPEMAGILIFTATTDSAGSLGGVVALSNPRRLTGAVAEMADRAAWCSSDPLCSESTAAGVDSLNLAACHACMLLPEVSCEEMNVLLDRAAVVDTPGAPGIGFLGQRFD